MKTQIGLYLDVEVTTRLRECANEVGTPIGTLAELLLKRGLTNVNIDALKEWARKIPNRGGPLAGGLTKNERTCLDGMKRLLKAQTPAWRFSAADVAKEMGLTPKFAFFGLRALQTRGIVTGHEDASAGFDRWERPLVSFWFIVGKDGQPVKTPAGLQP